MVRADTQDRVYQAFVERLVARRKELRMTQIDLAARLGTDQSQVSKFERRERRIDVVDFARFCLALEMDGAALFDELRDAISDQPTPDQSS